MLKKCMNLITILTFIISLLPIYPDEALGATTSSDFSIPFGGSVVNGVHYLSQSSVDSVTVTGLQKKNKKIIKAEIVFPNKSLDVTGAVTGDSITIKNLGGILTDVYGEPYLKYNNPGFMAIRSQAGDKWQVGNISSGSYLYKPTDSDCSGNPSRCAGTIPSGAGTVLRTSSGEAISETDQVDPPTSYYLTEEDVGTGVNKILLAHVTPTSPKIIRATPALDGIHKIDFGGRNGKGYLKMSMLLSSSHSITGVYKDDFSTGLGGYSIGFNYNLQTFTLWNAKTFKYDAKLRVTYSDLNGTKPDLVPIDIKNTTSIEIGKDTMFEFSFANNGVATNKSFYVRVFDGMTKIGEKVLSTGLIGNGGLDKGTFTYKFTASGSKTFTLKVDSTATIDEEDETNNIMPVTFTATNVPFPAPIGGDFTISKNPIDYNESTTFTPIGIDTGSCTYTSHKFRLSRNGSSWDTPYLTTKTSAYTMNYPYPASFITSGNVNVLLIVNSSCGEQNLINKTLTINDEPANSPPVANIFSANEVKAGDSVFVSGSGSFDPEDGEPTEYHFYYCKGALGTCGPNTKIGDTKFSSFEPLTEGVYSLMLIVVDSKGLTGTAEKEVLVTPPTPKAVVKLNGDLKVKRNIAADGSGSSSPSAFPINASTTKFTLSGLEGTDWIKIGNLVGTKKFNVMFYRQGEYNLTYYVKNSAGYEDTATLKFDVYPDENPVALLNFQSTAYRNPEDLDVNGKPLATFKITDSSYSTDGDLFVPVKSYAIPDLNNDGLFNETEKIPLAINTATQKGTFVANSVGKFKVIYQIKDSFDPDVFLPYIVDADYLRSKEFNTEIEVDNIPPSVSLTASKAFNADIFINLGDLEESDKNYVINYLSTLKSNLASNKVTSTIKSGTWDMDLEQFYTADSGEKLDKQTWRSGNDKNYFVGLTNSFMSTVNRSKIEKLSLGNRQVIPTNLLSYYNMAKFSKDGKTIYYIALEEIAPNIKHWIVSEVTNGNVVKNDTNIACGTKGCASLSLGVDEGGMPYASFAVTTANNGTSSDYYDTYLWSKRFGTKKLLANSNALDTSELAKMSSVYKMKSIERFAYYGSTPSNYYRMNWRTFTETNWNPTATSDYCQDCYKKYTFGLNVNGQEVWVGDYVDNLHDSNSGRGILLDWAGTVSRIPFEGTIYQAYADGNNVVLITNKKEIWTKYNFHRITLNNGNIILDEVLSGIAEIDTSVIHGVQNQAFTFTKLSADRKKLYFIYRQGTGQYASSLVYEHMMGAYDLVNKKVIWLKEPPDGGVIDVFETLDGSLDYIYKLNNIIYQGRDGGLKTYVSGFLDTKTSRPMTFGNVYSKNGVMTWLESTSIYTYAYPYTYYAPYKVFKVDPSGNQKSKMLTNKNNNLKLYMDSEDNVYAFGGGLLYIFNTSTNSYDNVLNIEIASEKDNFTLRTLKLDNKFTGFHSDDKFKLILDKETDEPYLSYQCSSGTGCNDPNEITFYKVDLLKGTATFIYKHSTAYHDTGLGTYRYSFEDTVVNGKVYYLSYYYLSSTSAGTDIRANDTTVYSSSSSFSTGSYSIIYNCQSVYENGYFYYIYQESANSNNLKITSNDPNYAGVSVVSVPTFTYNQAPFYISVVNGKLFFTFNGYIYELNKTSASTLTGNLIANTGVAVGGFIPNTSNVFLNNTTDSKDVPNKASIDKYLWTQDFNGMEELLFTRSYGYNVETKRFYSTENNYGTNKIGVLYDEASKQYKKIDTTSQPYAIMGKPKNGAFATYKTDMDVNYYVTKMTFGKVTVNGYTQFGSIIPDATYSNMSSEPISMQFDEDGYFYALVMASNGSWSNKDFAYYIVTNKSGTFESKLLFRSSEYRHKMDVTKDGLAVYVSYKNSDQNNRSSVTIYNKNTLSIIKNMYLRYQEYWYDVTFANVTTVDNWNHIIYDRISYEANYLGNWRTVVSDGNSYLEKETSMERDNTSSYLIDGVNVYSGGFKINGTTGIIEDFGVGSIFGGKEKGINVAPRKIVKVKYDRTSKKASLIFMTIMEGNNEGSELSNALAIKNVTPVIIGNNNTINNTEAISLVTQNNGTLIENVDGLETTMHQLEEWILRDLSGQEGEFKYFFLGERTNIEGGYFDFEGDGQRSNTANFKYYHDPSVFDNNQGKIAEDGQWINDPIDPPTKAGKYTVYYRSWDTPSANPMFNQDGNYAKLSNPMYKPLTFFVHRKPFAKFTVDVYEDAKNTSLVNTKFNDTSYDLDHSISDSNKGIVSREVKWKLKEDAVWTIGDLPISLSRGNVYIVSLRVKDVEGAWSDPNVQEVQTLDAVIIPNTKPTVSVLFPLSTDLVNPSQVNSLSARFEWKFNDTNIGDSQAKFNYEIVSVSTGTLLSYNEYLDYTLPSWNTTYQFRVRVSDGHTLNEWSDWSPYYYIKATANNQPVATLTSPSTSGTQASPTIITSVRPTLTWTQADLDMPATDYIKNYEIAVLDQTGVAIAAPLNFKSADGNSTAATASWTPIMDLPTRKKIQIKVRIYDSKGGVSPWTAISWIVIDKAPVATLTYPTGLTASSPSVTSNTTPTITWNQTDVETGTEFRGYQIQISNELNTVLVRDILIPASSTLSTASWVVDTPLAAGSKYRVRVRVKDDLEMLTGVMGLWSNWTSQYYIQIGNPPVANFDWSPKPVYEGDTIMLINQSTDPDGDMLTYLWTLVNPVGGTITSTLENPSIVPALKGTYSITLKATDPMGANHSVIKTITVLPLGIEGKVRHTAAWDEKRVEYNVKNSTLTDSPRGVEVFWAGEKFVLFADLTDTGVSLTKPIKVEALLNFDQTKTELVRSSDGIWRGTMWDDSFDQMEEGVYPIVFRSYWNNGVMKEDTVEIRIVDSIWDQVGTHGIH